MPTGFENVMSPQSEIWSTLSYDPALPFNGREWGHHLHLVGRVRPGIDSDRARQELEEIAAADVARFRPTDGPPFRMASLPIAAGRTPRSVRPALIAIVGAVILLLTIACVNVTNLLLAQGASRRGDCRYERPWVHHGRGSSASCLPKRCCSRQSAAPLESFSRTRRWTRWWRSALPSCPAAAQSSSTGRCLPSPRD